MENVNLLTLFNAVSKDTLSDIGLSGGDRIVIELTKRWYTRFKNISLITCTSGKHIIESYLGKNAPIQLTELKTPSSYYNNIYLLYIYKTLKCIQYLFPKKLDDSTIIFSSSDFFPDVIPAFIAKLKNTNVKWVASFYLFASSPFSSEFPYKGLSLYIRGIGYYLSQKLMYWLIRMSADYVVACNELDKKIFIQDGFSANRISAIYGGVDLTEANAVSEPSKKLYDGVFMARFHPQKGPLAALESWREVLRVNPNAKLLLIGNGLQEHDVDRYIKKYAMEKYVKWVEFADGKEKYKLLKSARIFIHSAIYDTGGMAAAEGMAAGLPVIAFDHPGYHYCYPKGISFVSPIGDTTKFAERVLELLSDRKRYETLRKEAMELAKEWDWELKSKFLLKEITLCVSRG